MFRQGLRALIEAEPDLRVIAEIGDGLGTVKQVEALRPDLLLLNCVLASLGGFEAARRARRSVPATRVLFISNYYRESHLLDAIQSGASGLLLREDSGSDLVNAIRVIYAGGRCFSRAFSPDDVARVDLLKRIPEHDWYASLTRREKEIFQLTLDNLTSAHCGRRLGISARTVEAHRANLMRKLGVRTQAELLRFAFERGLLPPGMKVNDSA
jgi:DNA-binding NarL/FixJ family response regulator